MLPVADFDSLVFSVAYNMTGDYERSKDVVQDMHLKFLQKPIPESVENPRSYIIRSTMNHCLNLKESREHYKGSWLPEPFLNFPESRAQQTGFENRNLLSYELAFLMEQLPPSERAVFVLREAFGFEHSEIAETLNFSSDKSRQLLHRARQKVSGLQHDTVSEKSKELAQKLVAFISTGDLEQVINLFSNDIVLTGDGGGKVPAIVKPLSGKEKVAGFFLKLFRGSKVVPIFHFTEVLSQPAVLILVDGKMLCAMMLSVSGNKIARIYNVLNPEKFAGLENYLVQLSQKER